MGDVSLLETRKRRRLDCRHITLSSLWLCKPIGLRGSVYFALASSCVTSGRLSQSSKCVSSRVSIGLAITQHMASKPGMKKHCGLWTR